jgi:hypothetical protein
LANGKFSEPLKKTAWNALTVRARLDF